MYLKRLEIHGFKSFADKVVLDFREGVSVVVGPNGSGKSNISDAIRWVLGEQSAKSLRGAKMEDIIFAGSVKRRPVGMAEVSLTLDNSTGIFPLDFAEITVTRRVFRSGESEYLINKSPCRLKDVHELFMDTGIGREGFSIIGQGRVEEILSSKPEDRRNLIEEAAGVTKYRNRKREATRKLDETEQNLLRLADIISELESQLTPLEEQAGKAQQYTGFKQELDELELDLYVHDIEDIGNRLEGCRGQIAETQRNIVTLETQLRVTEADSAELKLAMQALDEQIYQGQNNCHNFSSQIQQLESELKLCDQRTGAIQEQQRRLTTEQGEASQKSAALQAEFATEEAKVLILKQTRKELEAKLQDKEHQLTAFSAELGSAESQIENLKSEVFEVLSQSAKYNNELTSLNQQAENLEYRKQSLEGQRLAREQEQADVYSQVETVNSELAVLRDKVNGLVYTMAAQKQAHEQLNSRRRELQTGASGLKDRLQGASSRLRVLSDMQKDYEGYNRGVKEILQGASQNRLTGICGVVAELIQVPARLETALEVVLGGSLQNIVTESERDAKKGIAFLKSNNFGRATFLPLDTLQAGSRNFEARVLKATGVLGVAADLVEFEPKYRAAVEYLLGRILVVENLEQASQVAKLGNYKLRIVTLDGELLSPGGSMTGGSLQRRSSSLLGRNREIAQLEEQVKVFSRQLQEQNQQDEQLAAQLEEIVTNQSQTQAELKESEIALTALETKRATLAQDLDRAKREVAAVVLELEQILTESGRFEMRRGELIGLRDNSQAEYDSLSRRLAETQERFKDQGTAREQLLAAITELKVKTASLEQEEKGLHTALERYYQQKAEYKAIVTNRQAEHDQLAERTREIAAEVDRLKENLANLITGEAKAKEDLQSLRDVRQEKISILDAKEAAAKNLRQQLQGQQELLHSSQVKEARLDTEITTALNRLVESLQVSLEEAKSRSKPVVNRREVVGKVNRLKSEISALGPVNLGAVEEFDRVKERYSFLFTQQNDLQQAKASLFNVIAEMDRIMVERFGKAFAQIKERFANVFEELFGGGHAELQLTDPDNLLETGVEIIAQPPGKKPQHLSLLSGGEKALTAIALLFAILQVKPSPFSVLDEIEAALDEANVARFAAYLRELASLTQFIVISHRKGTMEAADVLYGVTMEENGVSKLYSVRMAETDENLAV